MLNGNVTANVQRRWNFVDTFFISAGTHQFKFGFDFRRLSPTSGLFNSLQVSAFSYAELQSAIVNTVVVMSDARISAKLDNYSSFAQDTWKVSPRLTLTYGLRWEINMPPVSTTPGKPLYAATGIFDSQPFGLAPAGTPLWHTRFDNFAPRIGAAWQVTPKTVLRGGFGLYYDLGIGSGVGDTMSGFPNSRSKEFDNQPFSLNNPAFTLPPFSLAPDPNTLFRFAFDPNLRVPVTYEWNFTIDQALGRNQRLSASYVGSYGQDLLREDFIQQPPTGFPIVITTVNGDWSHYSALQVQFQRRMTAGLQALLSYALAKSVDTNSSDVCECFVSNSLNNVNARADLGPSDFDVRNSFAAAVSYQVPGPRAGFVSALLRNWTVDGIVRSSSALPFSVIAGLSSRPNVLPGVPFYIPAPGEPGGRMLNSAAFTVPPIGERGDLPRNYFRAFPINQTDVALSRRIHLNERAAVYVRAE